MNFFNRKPNKAEEIMTAARLDVYRRHFQEMDVQDLIAFSSIWSDVTALRDEILKERGVS